MNIKVAAFIVSEKSINTKRARNKKRLRVIYRSQTCKYKDGGDWAKKVGGYSGVYFKIKMSTDRTLMSAMKNNFFHLREGQLLHICKKF